MTDQDDDTAPSGEMQALLMQADEVDGEAHATSAEGVMAAQAEQVELDQTGQNQREVRMILALAVPTLGAAFPSITELYSDQQCDLVAASLAPVMTKYGINLGGMTDRPELAALMICGPLAFATYKGIQADIAERKERKNQAPKAIASYAPKQAPLAPQHASLG